MVQNRVAWSRGGNRRWALNNLNNLCRGTANPSRTVACFKQGIRQHGNWQRATQDCRGNASGYRPQTYNPQPPRQPDFPPPQRARNVGVGPIWNGNDAATKCNALARRLGGRWNGQWRTTVPGRMSVCSIIGGRSSVTPQSSQDADQRYERQRAAEARAAQQRADQRRAAEARAARQRAEDRRYQQQRAAEARAAQQRADQQRAAQQRADQRRAQQQRAAQQRAAQQRAAQQRAAQQRAQQQRAAQQRAAQQRAQQQRAAQQRAAQQRAQQRAAQQAAARAAQDAARAARDTASKAGNVLNKANPFSSGPTDVQKRQRQCKAMLQGRVAWSRGGSKQWAKANLNNLCRRTNNPSATVSCFRRGIQQHNSWQRAIQSCRAR